jgi:hypothetical protein
MVQVNWYNVALKYGLTEERFLAMYVEQHESCAICHKPFGSTPCVDHDHDTGIVRGLLCSQCNTGLGMFKESIRTLAQAIVYLEGHGKTYSSR